MIIMFECARNDSKCRRDELLMWIRIVMKTWGQSVYVVTFALNYVTVVFVRVS